MPELQSSLLTLSLDRTNPVSLHANDTSARYKVALAGSLASWRFPSCRRDCDEVAARGSHDSSVCLFFLFVNEPESV